MVDVFDSQLNSGWIAKTNSVSNPTSLYKSGQGQVIFLKPEAQMTDISRIEPARVDQSAFMLSAEFEKDLFDLMGVSPENVGMSENDKIETAGVLAKARQAAGWIPLQPIFDGLRDSQQLLGRKVTKLIQLNYTPEKIRLITKKEPTPEFYSKTFGRYDIVVEEGVLTDTQKQQQFIQLCALKSMGVNVTDEELVANSQLHDKKPMEERFKAERDSAMQQQQQIAQLEMEKMSVLTKSIDHKANSDDALAEERRAKIGLDAALNMERIARAEEDKTAGQLNLVKALKELQGMDMDALVKGVEILKGLAEHHQMQNPPKEEPKAA